MIGIRKEECIGCGACSSICPKQCIKMKYDFEGFQYPFYDKQQCVHCGKCKSVCPVRQIKKKKEDMATIDSIYALAGYNTQNDVQEESSSGGVFPLLALAVLSKGGIVYGAAYNENFEVVHIGIRDREKLGKLQKSKYVQSNISGILLEIKEALERGNLVLFSGTPCQISALKSFLGMDYDNLLCLGVICHGVAAPKIWEKYLKVFHKGKQIEKINFRDKRYGWENLVFSITYLDGSQYSCPSNEEPFFRGFLKNLFLRKSCYHCEFRRNRSECDIMLGDAWGIDSYAKEVKSEKGTSLILAYTPKGEKWIKEIEDGLKHKRIMVGAAIRYNQRLIKSVQWNENRTNFYRDLKKRSFKSCMKKY